MPKRMTKFLNGLVLIDTFNITPQEELEKMSRLCGVVSFPSANHRSALKQEHQCSLAKNQSDEEGI
jgi:hypothetical protein